MIPKRKRKPPTREQLDAKNLRTRQKTLTREQLDAKNATRRAWRERNPDKVRDMSRAHEATRRGKRKKKTREQRDAWNASRRARRERNPDKVRAEARGTWRGQLDAKNAQAREKRADRTPEQIDVDRSLLRERYATDVDYREKKRAEARVNNKKRKSPTREDLDARSSRQREKYATDATVREKAKAQRLRKYGITAADYQKMIVEQGGVCAICLCPPTGRDKRHLRLHVDHCHTTGRVRGLLCYRCNLGAGFFGDDPDRLERAAGYLRTGCRNDAVC